MKVISIISKDKTKNLGLDIARVLDSRGKVVKHLCFCLVNKTAELLSFKKSIGTKKTLEDTKKYTYFDGDLFDQVVLECEDYCEYLILDVNADSSVGITKALTLSNSYMLNINVSKFQVDDVSALFKKTGRAKACSNNSLKFLGIIFSEYSKKSKLSNLVVQEYTKMFGKNVMKTIIPCESMIDRELLLIRTYKLVEEILCKQDMLDIETSFRELDNHFFNDLKSGLVLFGGRPDIGKTSFMLTYVREVSMSTVKSVVYFSLDSKCTKLASMLLSNESKIDISKFRTKSFTSDDLNEVSLALSRLSERNILINGSMDLSITDIKKCCEEAKKENDLAMVVIDYLELVANGEKHEVLSELKALSEKIECPIVILSQFNQIPEVEEGRMPSLNDIWHWDDIKKHIDSALLLHRGGHYNELCKDRSLALLHIYSNSLERATEVRLSWDSTTRLFTSGYCELKEMDEKLINNKSFLNEMCINNKLFQKSNHEEQYYQGVINDIKFQLPELRRLLSDYMKAIEDVERAKNLLGKISSLPHVFDQNIAQNLEVEVEEFLAE